MTGSQVNETNWSSSDSAASLSLGEAQPLDNDLTITFVSDRDGQLSELLNLSSSLNAEVYKGDELVPHAIQLNPSASAGFRVYQNEPNPFANNTLIKYQLPYEANVSLSFYDPQGKLLKTVSEKGNKGINTIEVSPVDLRSGSVSYTHLTLPTIYSV